MRGMNRLTIEVDRGQGWRLSSERDVPLSMTIDQILHELRLRVRVFPIRARLNWVVVGEVRPAQE